jgi:hypothetical protein
VTEIDAVLRDLEAGLFLQTQTRQAPAKHASSDFALPSGLLTIAVEGRQIEPSQALIGRDFVAWADAQGLVIVPGRRATIRVEKSRTAESAPSFVMKHKLKLAKYLRALAGQHLQLELRPALTNVAGSLVDVKGDFALINSGTATAFVELSKIRLIRLPVHNLSEKFGEAFRW